MFGTLTGALGESAEPGIVLVSKDTNGNGLEDDEWYELAGSEYNSPATTKNYTITYYRPSSPKETGIRRLFRQRRCDRIHRFQY